MPSIVEFQSDGDVLTARVLETRLMDEATIGRFHAEIIEGLGKKEEPNLLIDFSRVHFLSSSALGALLRVHKKCKEYKVALKLCNIAPDIHQVFKITNLVKVFDIYGDEADAYKAFQKKGGFFFRG